MPPRAGSGAVCRRRRPCPRTPLLGKSLLLAAGGTLVAAGLRLAGLVLPLPHSIPFLG